MEVSPTKMTLEGSLLDFWVNWWLVTTTIASQFEFKGIKMGWPNELRGLGSIVRLDSIQQSWVCWASVSTVGTLSCMSSLLPLETLVKDKGDRGERSDISFL